MSWDNFFFAFSGASAALIGVTFAFVVAKLLNNISDFDNLRNETTELIIERQSILNDISNIAFLWHDEMIIKYGYQLKQKYNNGEFIDDDKIIDRIEKDTNRRIFYPEKALNYIVSEIEKLKEKDKKRQIPAKAYVDGEETTIMITPPNLLSNMPEIPFDKELWKNINSEEEKYEACYQKSNIQIYKFKYVMDKINAKINDFRVVRNVITAFIPITVLTVIYPLHFIPTKEGECPKLSFSISNFFNLWLSLKGWLLTILFVSTVGSMFYFIHLCRKHIKNYKQIKKMISDDYIDIKKYSELFSKKDTEDNK